MALQRWRDAEAGGRVRSGAILAVGAAALAAAAVYNARRARRIQREMPPTGRFVTVDGVRLHYLEKGEGPPVVLLHGNLVEARDFALSGVLDLAAGRHRVVAFDRPGFGHSDRPRGKAWTARQQAELLHRAFERLGIVRPVVVGHSWGCVVALAMALARPDSVRGLVLAGGYYFPTARLDALMVAPAALPVVGDVLRHTVLPLLGRVLTPLMLRSVFDPAPIPPGYAGALPVERAVRPSQIRATAQDGATMVPTVAGMRRGYGDLRMPVAIFAGTGDHVVGHEAHAVRLHHEIASSELRLIAGAGHMVHHAVPELVADAIDAVAAHPAVLAEPEAVR
ncbi:alpha/beta hydrolase [Arenibaculum sp.]|uniref:alpha/beta fold hydrolase n=1 Tax=Arenibaculum sp. TaxID=2865862 RepID=UPI002E12DE9A|nr:alpha/beta hydrolase [Arenibaculum sp.]